MILFMENLPVKIQQWLLRMLQKKEGRILHPTLSKNIKK
jgi:hypothetical protein